MTLSLNDRPSAQLRPKPGARTARTWSAVEGPWRGEGIAIVGMAGRFPASRDIEELWQNLRAGRDCISRLSEETLRREGVAESVLRGEGFVPAGGVLDDIELFDAGFFGVSPREAESMDPQQRLFLEVVQHALDDAGCDPERAAGPVGVYAGCRLSGYWLRLLNDAEFMSTMGWHQVAAGNDKDFLATQVSFRFNLRGPSVNVQAACSTSLLAVALACDALVSRHCDVAVAGAASVAVPHRIGYIYQPSGIASPDGKCRPFDAGANGSVLGNGVAAVVLKRVADALADGDRVYAVIRSAATNNDGRSKSSFAAPSVQGQAEVVAKALRDGGVTPEDLDYIEAHGTATALGDPIEVAALARAFASYPPRRGPSLIGSVKGNLGHLDPAAGVTSLIKVALSLHRGEIPPSINFEKPNPAVDFEAAGLRVASELKPWPRLDTPRRAGVSSFGIGGTNVHAVLEEAPAAPEPAPGRPHHLLTLSAKSEEALRALESETADYLEANPQTPLDHAAFTLNCGRRQFAHRSWVVAATHAEACAALRRAGRTAGARHLRDREVFYLFPGQGTQHLKMGHGLYRAEPVFRDAVDEVAGLMTRHLGFDLRALVSPEEFPCEGVRSVQPTEIAQPFLFAVEYAAARLWLHWGVRPHGMLGHSVGELVAACVADVMSLESGARAVCERGRLMQQMTPGAMLAVSLEEEAAREFEDGEVCVSAMNGPRQQCLSGPVEAIQSLEERLARQGVEYRRLHTSHAFHHPSMRAAAEQMGRSLREVELGEPRIPFVSNLTGDWVTREQATDPEYWAATIVSPVRFSDGMRALAGRPNPVFIECGPARTLTGLALAHPCEGDRVVVSSLSHVSDNRPDSVSMDEALGTVWQAGAAVNWDNVWRDRGRRRVTLPGYPFQRKRHWREAPAAAEHAHAQGAAARRGVWENCFGPSWQLAPAPPAAARSESDAWVVLADSGGPGLALCHLLAGEGRSVVAVVPGAQFRLVAERVYSVDVRSADDFERLAEQLAAGDGAVHIVNCWTTAAPTGELTVERGELGVLLGFGAPVTLLQTLLRSGRTVASAHTVTCNLFGVGVGETPDPTFAPALGIARVLPQEMQGVRARVIDVSTPLSPRDARLAVGLIHAEVTSEAAETVVAYRGGMRLTEAFHPVGVAPPDALGGRLREGGTYLVTGGFGGIGGVLAALIASTVKARIVLVGRRVPGGGEDTGAGGGIVRELERSGAAVLPLSADVSEPAEVERLVREVRERFGPINGVIHAAGVAGGGMLVSRDMEAAAAVFAPKVRGTIALLRAVASDRPDFIVLCSSFAAVAGGVGQADYCGANAFLDAVAGYARGAGLPATSINWPAWKEVGMAAAMSLPPELEALKQASLLAGISPSEGAELFASVVAADLPRVVIPPLSGEAGAPALGGTSSTHAAPRAERPPRPHAGAQAQHAGAASPASDARAPDGDLGAELERRLAGVWSQVLGIDAVGGEDNFFQLGGQSLMALRIVALVREQFLIEINLGDLFDKPTLREFAGHVQSKLVESVATMPEERVRELLTAQAKK